MQGMLRLRAARVIAHSCGNDRLGKTLRGWTGRLLAIIAGAALLIYRRDISIPVDVPMPASHAVLKPRRCEVSSPPAALSSSNVRVVLPVAQRSATAPGSCTDAFLGMG